MSQFLLSQEQFYWQAKTRTNIKLQPTGTAKQKTQSSHFGNIIKNQLKSYRECYLNKTVYKNQDQLYVLLMFELSFGFKALFSIRFPKHVNAITFFVDILTLDLNYYKTSNHQQTVQISRNIAFQQHSLGSSLACLKLDPSSGRIKIQLPLFLTLNWPTLTKSEKTGSVIELLLRSLVQPHVALITGALRSVLRDEGRTRASDLVLQKANKIVDRINCYNLVSNVSTHISCHPQSYFQMAHRNSQKQKITLKSMFKNRQAVPPCLIKNAQLFAYSPGEDSSIQDPIEEFNLPTEEKLMRSKIAVPLPCHSDLPHQNYMIENRVELHNINQIMPMKIASGGFADIYLAEISYSYPLFQDQHTPDPQKQPEVLSEPMVLKMEVVNRLLFDQQCTEEEYASRRYHQSRIIHKMKTGKSIYLPRYYFPTNAVKSKYVDLSKCLLMEYIPCQSLGQLLEDGCRWVSLHTKLSLMYSICQGLRYLRDFDIVHLDLKPNNIMTYHNFHVKLIDFGESYHYEVCQEGFKPGFTLPYSPPEIFLDKTSTFTSKSDVFSFAVIFYQMLFNKFPFDIHRNTTVLDDQMTQYLARWHYCPEDGESYGQAQLIRVFSVLISRCLVECPQDRSELDWISLMLKYALEVID